MSIQEKPVQSGIGGWLLLPLLALVVQPISFIFNSIVPFFKIHYPYSLRINYPILLGDALLVLIVCLVAYLFFTKKKITPAVYISYSLLLNLMWNIVDGIFETQKDPPFIGMFFHALVLVPYFVYSSRVKATFIKNLDEQSFIDKLLKPVEKLWVSFYDYIYRNRRWLYPWIIAYLLFLVMLNCVLRSLRIYGDIIHTLEFL